MSLRKLCEFLGEEVKKEHIALHIKYDTCLWLEKNNEIVAYVQWNIDKTTAHITHLKIKEGINGKKVMYYFRRQGRRKFPYATHIEFERELRNDLRKRKFKLGV